MSLALHQLAADGLASILQIAWRRAGIKNRVESVRFMLDEWLICEYTTEEELTTEILNRIYYQSIKPTSKGALREEDLEALKSYFQQVKETIRQGYADCGPVRDVIQKLEMAERSLHRWQ